ncbi:MAG: chemotaxis protein CheC [Deltaproteobacteria bacterium]|nr:chemotaxis protein CheC [Deltaproteobacteria bacterium]
MTTTFLNPDQVDALRELANIAMGRAANALAQIIGIEVTLNVPNVEEFTIDALIAQIVIDAEQHDDIVLTRQAFSNGLAGEAVVLFFPPIAGDQPVTEEVDEELLLEMTNIIVGAFFGSLTEPLDIVLYFSPPSIVPPEGLTNYADRGWDCALVLDIELGTHGFRRNCRLLMVFPETSAEKIRNAVDKLLMAL